MWNFSPEGRRAAAIPCPATGHKHDPDPAAAQVDTFYCRRCGAVSKDSAWHDPREESATGEDHPGPSGT